MHTCVRVRCLIVPSSNRSIAVQVALEVRSTSLLLAQPVLGVGPSAARHTEPIRLCAHCVRTVCALVLVHVHVRACVVLSRRTPSVRSGHGMQLPDKNGDEADGMDEAIVATVMHNATPQRLVCVHGGNSARTRGGLPI